MSQRVALYARVSSDKQAKEGTVDSQLDALHRYANEHAIVVDDDLVFTDNGASGASMVRPALDALRDKAALGVVDKVVIHSPDRLARKHIHQMILIEEFQKLGVEIVFCNRQVSNSPEDQLLLQVQGVIAEYEREKIIERGRRGRLHKAKLGKVSALSRSRFGYVYLPAAGAQEARYEIHVEQAKVVRRIFEMYVMERLSADEIAKQLSRDLILTKSGLTRWSHSTIWEILTSSVYIGKATFGKKRSHPRTEKIKLTKATRDRGGYTKRTSIQKRRPKEEWIVIPVPAIVKESLFARAQEIRALNAQQSRRNNKRNEYLLTSLLHCKECGYSWSGRTVSGSPHLRYYRCSGTMGNQMPDRKRRCSSHTVHADVFDDLVWERTKQLIDNPELVLQEYSDRLLEKKRLSDTTESLLAKKKKEIRALEVQKQRLLDLYQQGTVALAEITIRLDGIRAMISKVEYEHKNLEREAQHKGRQLQLIQQFAEFKATFTQNLDNLPFDQKKRIVRLLVEGVVIDQKNHDILVKHIVPVSSNGILHPSGHCHFPFQELFAALD